MLKNKRWTHLVGIVAIVIAPSAVHAVGWTVSTNTHYFESIKVSTASIMLSVTCAGKCADKNRISVSRTYGHDAWKVCRFGAEEKRPDHCQIVPASTGGEYGSESFSYDVLVLERRDRDKWFRVLLNPRSGESAWISTELNKDLEFRALNVEDWIARPEVLPANNIKDVPIKKEASDSSSVVGYCSKKEANPPHFSFLGSNKEIKGQWLRVACETEACFTSLHDECIDEPKNNQGKPACVEGWTRWIEPNGHILLYPGPYDPC